MAKLYFRFGVVGSAKTLNLLAVAHNYERQQKSVLVLKRAADSRCGAERVAARAGLERRADALIEEGGRIDRELVAGCHCVLVDEAQFLSGAAVETLRELSRSEDVPIICYGLRTDFRGRLFDGSRRLLELADSIEEVKTTCHFCNRKAVFNLKLRDGEPTVEGPVCELGCEELYIAVCYAHWAERLGPQLPFGPVHEGE